MHELADDHIANGDGNTSNIHGVNENGTPPSTEPSMSSEATSAPYNFAPPESEMIQIVDYEDNFNSELSKFLKVGGLNELGFDYHVTSILGAQSSGKSTLLNLLFGTKFQTMDEQNGRYQVTQGVWLGLDTSSSTIILDLEGTDSRERGELAANFERKIALFGLALSEVLIVNLWAQDVGRYSAANMDLLKTVMELNLQLFYGKSNHNNEDEGGQQQHGMHKTKLLFVLRDHVASPLDKLSDILRSDVDNIWSNIQKPEFAEDIEVTDLFDIEFFALPHKLLMSQEFEEKGNELRRQFMDGEVFHEEYQSGISSDGFAAYADNIWNTIRSNKELDIPSQKDMLAHVRCEQIARDSFEIFENKIGNSEFNDFNDDELILKLSNNADTICEVYQSNACRYSNKVAILKQDDLIQRIAAKSKIIIDQFLYSTTERVVLEIRDVVEGRWKKSRPWEGWIIERESLLKNGELIFDKKTKGVNEIDDANPLNTLKSTIDSEREKMIMKIEEIFNRFDSEAKTKAKEYVIQGFTKKVRGPLTAVVEKGNEDVWEIVSDIINQEYNNAISQVRTIWSDKGVGMEGIEDGEETKVEKGISSDCVIKAKDMIKEAVGTPSTILMRLTKKFDDSFRFDDNGIPRHFGPHEKLDEIYTESQQRAVVMIESLSKLNLKGDFLDDSDDGGDDDDGNILLDEIMKEDLKDKLRRQAHAVYMEAQRAQQAAQAPTQTPPWLLLLIVVLGWNEFMTLVRNPILLLLTVVIVPVVYLGYFVNAHNVLGPAVMNVISPFIEQAKLVMIQLLDSASDDRGPGNQPTGALTGDGTGMGMANSGSGVSGGGLSTSTSSSSSASSSPIPVGTEDRNDVDAQVEK